MEQLSLTLSVVTKATFVHRFPNAADGEAVVVANQGAAFPLSGRARRLDVVLRLRLAPITTGGAGEMTARLTSYVYQLSAAGGAEILAYHWHPGSAEARPHLHISAAAGSVLPELQRAHLPTGKVELAEFIRLLVRDFGVRPLRKDWRRVLGVSAQP
ncbi:MAG: hypothetical protein C0506_04530 [Anaerolinea sp.]|nr:hypothetical protein [Anaerolinea sp.]